MKTFCEKLVSDAESAVKFSNDLILDNVRHSKNFLGIVSNDGSLIDISKARAAMEPSSLYGHHYGRDLSIALDIRKQGIDIHEFDDDGITKNSLGGESAACRVKKAKANGFRVVFMFGGSTMFGQGSRLPEFTIPSLVEKILSNKEGYNSPAICINFGLGGTCSSEALSILIHKALDFCQPDDIIFYDGWNCASYLPLQYLAENNYKNVIHKGEITRHLEHNLYLKNSYCFSYYAWRATKLAIHSTLSFVAPLIPGKNIRRLVTKIMNILFPLKTSLDCSRIIDALLNEESNRHAYAKASAKYLSLHKIASSICDDRRIRFHHIMQPLVFFGKKKLTKDEDSFRTSGFSSGDPSQFMELYKLFLEDCRAMPWFYDFTSSFDNVESEVYIDSGHLNPIGNTIIAMKIAELLNSASAS